MTNYRIKWTFSTTIAEIVTPVFTAAGLLLLTACGQSSPTKAEIATVKADIAVDNAGVGAATHGYEKLDCKIVCNPNNPDYRCLFAGTLGSGHDKQIMDLAARLSKPQPVTMTHKELLLIFGLSGSGYDNARQATMIVNDVLSNEGTPSEIKTSTTA